MQDHIKVKVLFFSVLKQKMNGISESILHLPKNATGEILLDALEEANEALKPYRPFIRLAINQQYKPHEVALEAGDEIALITPVSGG